MIGKILDNGLIVIKKDVRTVLRLCKGDLVHLVVEKVEPAKIQEVA